jgi:hypothetical protein
MNKLEKARVKMLESELRVVKALRFVGYNPAKIDIMEATTGKDWNTVSRGWTFNVHSLRVWQGWFRSSSHGTWPREEGNSASQGCGGPWYVTRRDALMALRIQLTNRYAETLAAIDEQIEGSDDPD